MKRHQEVLVPVDGKEDIKKSVFRITKPVQLTYRKVNSIDSTNLSPVLMKKVFDEIVENYNQFDSFVILTGTDTLSYLASFLSFWLQNIHKPVILTGSQKPLNMLGSDAPGNIYYSILFSCEKVPGISVFFGKHLFRGNRVTKVDSRGFDAFDSPNFLPIGHTDALRHKIFEPLTSLLLSPGKEKFKYAWSDRVHVVNLYPGFDPKILFLLEKAGYKGFIIRAFGLGNLPDRGKYSLAPAVKDLNSRGVIIGVVSSCLKGTAQVEYETAQTFKKLDVLFLGDMTCEAAYAKMSFLMGLENDPDKIKELMVKPLAGEMTAEFPAGSDNCS